jgi:hypothetical protein
VIFSILRAEMRLGHLGNPPEADNEERKCGENQPTKERRSAHMVILHSLNVIVLEAGCACIDLTQEAGPPSKAAQAASNDHVAPLSISSITIPERRLTQTI